MDELTSLYYDIVNKIENVDLGEEILAVHEQLTDIENRDINILKTASDYLVGLPEDKTSKFSVCVLGAAGHHIAHLIEMRYPGADVYWINNTNDNPEQYDGVMDYMICERDPDIVFDSWKWSLHDGSTVFMKKEMVFKSTDEKKETIDIINRCCRSGFSYEISSNDMIRLTRVIPERAAESLESKYKKVYVACPSFFKTGGPELLHQLVYWLNHYFGNAVIAYLDYGEEKRAKVPFSHPELFHYVSGSTELFEEIEDSPENVLVVPEGWSLTCTKVKNMKQMFWWLSVDNFISSVTYGGQDDQENTKKVLNMLDNVIDLHLVQSEYAGDYIRKNGFPDDRIEYLSDYINQTYLDNADTALECPKEDIVLYNPKKGFDFVEKVMKVSPDLQWRAIEKMTTIQVGELMRKAKVYIDFGNHPGKDRIPREAAVSGCIVITGRKGSAAYFEDVPIPEKYKIAEEEGSAEKVADVIRQSIKDYDTLIHDFDDYRARILSEKERFIKDAIRIFGK